MARWKLQETKKACLETMSGTSADLMDKQVIFKTFRKKHNKFKVTLFEYVEKGKESGQVFVAFGFLKGEQYHVPVVKNEAVEVQPMGVENDHSNSEQLFTWGKGPYGVLESVSNPKLYLAINRTRKLVVSRDNKEPFIITVQADNS